MRNDTIHRFIQALDKGELRYCRKALLGENGSQTEVRLKLFDVLVKMKQFDREAIKNAMDKDLDGARLAEQKSKLFRFLVNQVTLLRQNRNAETNLWSILLEGKLFLSLGLIEEAYDVVKSGIELAVKLEELNSEVVLRELFREILKNMNGSLGLEEVTQNEYLLETAANKLSTLVKYTLINDRMFALNKRYGFSKDPALLNGVKELMKTEHLQNVLLANSLPAQLRFYRTLAGYYASINDLESALENLERCLALWESNPSRIQLYPHVYLSVLNNLLGKLSLLGRLEESPKYLKKIESLKVSSRRDEVLKFTYVETQYHLYLMNSGHLLDAANREDKITMGLTKYGLKIPEDSRITFRYNIAVSSLLSGDPRKALYWFNQVREMGILQSRQDLQGIARLFRLLLIHENDSSGNYAHFLRNSKRFFTAKHPGYVIETKVYTWLQKYKEVASGLERKQAYGVLVDSIKEFSTSKIVGAEELYLFALSRLQGVNLLTLYKQKLQMKSPN